jgi:hypothetical protein
MLREIGKDLGHDVHWPPAREFRGTRAPTLGVALCVLLAVDGFDALRVASAQTAPNSNPTWKRGHGHRAREQASALMARRRSWVPDRRDMIWIDCNPPGRQMRHVHPLLGPVNTLAQPR